MARLASALWLEDYETAVKIITIHQSVPLDNLELAIAAAKIHP